MISQKKFEKELYTYTEASIRELADKSLTGIALLFDESFVSVRFIATVQPLDRVGFNPDEWETQVSVTSPNIVSDLYEQCEDYDNNEFWHEQFQSRAYQAAANMFESIKYSYDSKLKNTFLIIWVSDSELNQTKSKAVAKRLNSKAHYEKFVSFIDDCA